MKRLTLSLPIVLLLLVALVAGCQSAATPTPAATAKPAATTAPAGTAAPAATTNYPTKAVNLMVAYPAGGTTDIGARILAAIAEKELGQSIVVVNKAGAGGQVGWSDMATQKPDGYYIGMVNLPLMNTIILDPERKATFNIDSFVPVINQVVDPGVAYVKPDSPYKTLKDVVEDAKKRPGKVTGGTSGILSDDHLAMLMIEDAAGVKLQPVHFEGDAPKMTAMLGGQIDIAFANVGGFVPKVKTGEYRALAVFDKERSKFMPDVPTAAEQGFPNLISVVTRGYAVPKGTPPDVIKKIETSFKKAMETPEHIQKMEDAGYVVKVMIGEEYAKHYKEIHEQSKKFVEMAKKQ